MTASLRVFCAGAALTGLLGLTIALAAERFGFAPCPLCYAQRGLWVAAACLAALNFFAKNAALLTFSGLRGLFCVLFLLSIWHSAAEFDLIRTQCGGGASGDAAKDAQALLAALRNTAPADCGVRRPFIFHLSFANISASAAFSLFVAASILQRRKGPQ